MYTYNFNSQLKLVYIFKIYFKLFQDTDIKLKHCKSESCITYFAEYKDRKNASVALCAKLYIILCSTAKRSITTYKKKL